MVLTFRSLAACLPPAIYVFYNEEPWQFHPIWQEAWRYHLELEEQEETTTRTGSALPPHVASQPLFLRKRSFPALSQSQLSGRPSLEDLCPLEQTALLTAQNTPDSSPSHAAGFPSLRDPETAQPKQPPGAEVPVSPSRLPGSTHLSVTASPTPCEHRDRAASHHPPLRPHLPKPRLRRLQEYTIWARS